MSLTRDKTYFNTSMVYLGITAFSLLFMGVYYAVDHGLRDLRMTLLFIPPLVVFILFSILTFATKNSGGYWKMFFHMGFASIYLYLICSSIITMANCTNRHLAIFIIVGVIFFVISLIILIIEKTSKNQTITNK